MAVGTNSLTCGFNWQCTADAIGCAVMITARLDSLPSPQSLPRFGSTPAGRQPGSKTEAVCCIRCRCLALRCECIILCCTPHRCFTTDLRLFLPLPLNNHYHPKSARGGGEALPDFFFLFFFPCSADHERDWPPCNVVFSGWQPMR